LRRFLFLSRWLFGFSDHPIRLRGEPIKPSPKLSATIADSVQLARMALEAVEGKG
jgi:hypothetical protein